MRVLITGITGMAGSHLAEYCLSRGDVEVVGTVRWRSPRENIAGVVDRVRLVDCDLRDQAGVRRLLEQVRPDAIFHLAAQSYVPASWTGPADTLTTNVLGQVHLLEAMRDLGMTDVPMQIAGSSEEYGLVLPEETPIKETNPLRPLSPYAVSKVAQDMMAYQYFQSYGLKTVRTRGFNHTGPRRGEVFVTSNFCKQVASIELGLQEPVLRVGNLEAVRDFTDVRDMVRAYWLAATKGKPGEVYNVATGSGITIQELLDRILGLSSAAVEVVQDPERMRPSDVVRLIGDASRFRADTGWEPEVPFEKTLADLLEYWRRRLSRGTS